MWLNVCKVVDFILIKIPLNYNGRVVKLKFLFYEGKSQFNGIQNLCVGAVLHNFIDMVEKGEWWLHHLVLKLCPIYSNFYEIQTLIQN